MEMISLQVMVHLISILLGSTKKMLEFKLLIEKIDQIPGQEPWTMYFFVESTVHPSFSTLFLRTAVIKASLSLRIFFEIIFVE